MVSGHSIYGCIKFIINSFKNIIIYPTSYLFLLRPACDPNTQIVFRARGCAADLPPPQRAAPFPVLCMFAVIEIDVHHGKGRPKESW